MACGGGNTIPFLSGSSPGLLDASQPCRLLRTATCSLFFASFDPHTARVDLLQNISSLNIDPNGSSSRVNPETAASTNGKRVVIETDPENGTCTWRFVPRARTEGEFLGDEGPWPRLVSLSGRTVRMTQDQWDIHKLDPDYVCIVHASPNLTTITRVSDTCTYQPNWTPHPCNPTMPMSSGSPNDTTPTPKTKRDISPTPVDFKSDHQAWVADDQMAVDEDPFFLSTPAFKEDMMNDKKRRRESGPLWSSLSSDSGSSNQPAGKPTDPSFNSRSSNEAANDSRDSHIQRKRLRTYSPETIRREMEQKRMSREKKRKKDMESRVKARQAALREAFWRKIGVNLFDDEDLLPRDDGDDFEAEADEVTPNDTSECDHSEAERQAAIEESRRKLAELEKDRPLWEESARNRREREVEEELFRKRQKEKREEEARFQERMRASQKRREAQWEQELKEHERQARIREQTGRMFVSQPRNIFRWNSRLALERYIRVSEDFDKTRFTAPVKPMSFAQIPWPVLHASFSVQDIDWDTVEAFFEDIQRFLKPAEFKELVAKSHKRFHPDRWRSRGLLMSVQNETERDLLEVAGSTVAQAITPLWKEVTGRT